MTLEEIKQAIQEGSFHPSELFNPKALAKDPSIEELVEEKVSSQMKARGYNIRKSAELEEDRKKWLEEKKAMDDQVANLNRELAKGRVGELFEKVKKDRKLDDRQVNFIKGRLAKFEPKDPKDLDKEFSGHVDKEIDEYNMAAQIFGIKKDEDGEGQAKGKDTKKDGAGTEKVQSGEIEDKYLDPAQNPFIPKY